MKAALASVRDRVRKIVIERPRSAVAIASSPALIGACLLYVNSATGIAVAALSGPALAVVFGILGALSAPEYGAHLRALGGDR